MPEMAVNRVEYLEAQPVHSVSIDVCWGDRPALDGSKVVVQALVHGVDVVQRELASERCRDGEELFLGDPDVLVKRH